MRIFAGRRIGRRGMIGVSVNPVGMVKGAARTGASIARQFPFAMIVFFIGVVVCICVALYVRHSQ